LVFVPLLTVCESVDDVLVAKFVAPLYTATMVWLPLASASLIDAAPLVSVTGDPYFVPSTLNCTVPVGVPHPDVTVAVN
jgi:hypothetical protein